MNRYMIGPTLKPWDLYDSRKEKLVDKWLKNQNLIIPITLWFNKCDNKNYSNCVVAKENINIRKIKIKMRNIEH
jgi:hypothetical protein